MRVYIHCVWETCPDFVYRVAVKLQHPALAEWIPLDMSLTRWAFTNVRYFFPEYPLLWLSDEMEAS